MSDAGGTVGRDLEIPLPPTRRLFVRLEDLRDEENPSGRRVRYQKPSLRVVRLIGDLERSAAGTQGQLDAMWAVAGELLPDLGREDLERLSGETVWQLIEMAMTPLGDLEARAKNGEAPSAKAEKGSNSPTPSPTRSPASAKRTRRRSMS